MKKLLTLSLAVIFVVSMFSMAIAAAKAKSISGEVVKYEAGKTIVVKDKAGKSHTLGITKTTKVEGEVAVGGKVKVEVVGLKATVIKAEAAAPAPAPEAPAPSAPAPAEPAK